MTDKKIKKILGDFFKRVPKINELEFKHTEDKMHDACGISGEDITEILTTSREMVLERAEKQDNRCSRSQTVEDLLNHYSKEELALISGDLIHRELRAQEMSAKALAEIFGAQTEDHSCQDCSGECKEGSSCNESNPDEQPYEPPKDDDTSFYIG